MTPRYRTPNRSQTSRTALENEAMQIPGRFTPDGASVEWTDLKGNIRRVQMNRKYRRSGGRSS